jgi:hypothetical protein
MTVFIDTGRSILSEDFQDKMSKKSNSIFRGNRPGKFRDEPGSDEIICYENPEEEIAFKCIHSGTGKPSKYYVKRSGRDEYEVGPDSGYILMAFMKARQISKAKYDHYHLIRGLLRSREGRKQSRKKRWIISG